MDTGTVKVMKLLQRNFENILKTNTNNYLKFKFINKVFLKIFLGHLTLEQNEMCNLFLKSN